MANYGNLYGPNFTFLGIPACDLEIEKTYADADVAYAAVLAAGVPPVTAAADAAAAAAAAGVETHRSHHQ